MPTGVYAIRNKVNGKHYVGSARTSIIKRFNDHRIHLRKGNHCNRYLQFAWNKYGAEAFDFIVLEDCEPAKCFERETYWIAELKSADREYGYNLYPVAGAPLGVKQSAEQRAKQSARLKGKPHSPEHRAKLAEANRSPERRASAMKAIIGRPMSQKTREIFAAHNKKPKAPETRAKIAAALKGRKLSEETKAKISSGSKGADAEYRAKLIAAAARMTPEYRRRRSQRAAAKRWGRLDLLEEAS